MHYIDWIDEKRTDDTARDEAPAWEPPLDSP